MEVLSEGLVVENHFRTLYIRYRLMLLQVEFCFIYIMYMKPGIEPLWRQGIEASQTNLNKPCIPYR